MSRLIGLDPGLRITGWGIVEVHGNRVSHVAHGVVTSDASSSFAERLVQLYDALEKVFEAYHPLEAAVEETFVNTNATTSLKLGAARGVVMLAPARRGMFVSEYSANRVKKAVVGVGHAEKDQVAMMVQRLLPTAGHVIKDAADALAVALCHAHFRQTTALYKEKER